MQPAEALAIIQRNTGQLSTTSDRTMAYLEGMAAKDREHRDNILRAVVAARAALEAKLENWMQELKRGMESAPPPVVPFVPPVSPVQQQQQAAVAPMGARTPFVDLRSEILKGAPKFVRVNLSSADKKKYMSYLTINRQANGVELTYLRPLELPREMLRGIQYYLPLQYRQNRLWRYI